MNRNLIPRPILAAVLDKFLVDWRVTDPSERMIIANQIMFLALSKSLLHSSRISILLWLSTIRQLIVTLTPTTQIVDMPRVCLLMLFFQRELWITLPLMATFVGHHLYADMIRASADDPSESVIQPVVNRILSLLGNKVLESSVLDNTFALGKSIDQLDAIISLPLLALSSLPKKTHKVQVACLALVSFTSKFQQGLSKDELDRAWQTLFGQPIVDVVDSLDKQDALVAHMMRQPLNIAFSVMQLLMEEGYTFTPSKMVIMIRQLVRHIEQQGQ